MAVVVRDTSPLRALAFLRHLDRLRQLFGEVYLPSEVARKLATPPSRFAPLDITAWPFLILRDPTNTQSVDELSDEVDRGEAQAIVLAQELDAALLLIDETAGRRVATNRGLAVVGTLGLLLEFKTRGWCTEITADVDRLRNQLGFYIADDLRKSILTQAGEMKS